MLNAPALILEVFKQEDCLKIGLFDQSQALPTLRHYNQVEVSFDELKQLSLEMVNLLNKSFTDHESSLEQLKDLQKIGQLLWNHLLMKIPIGYLLAKEM